MARAGGQSAISGFSFQAWAIARAFVDVYQGTIDFVRAETPPRTDFGPAGIIRVTVDDYVIQRAKTRIYHQAKSNPPGGGTWTLNKLQTEEILQDFIEQLGSDSSSECCLVTSSDCPLLGEVANRARNSISVEEFNVNITSEFQGLIDDACLILGISNVILFWFLRHCRLEIRTSEQIKKELHSLSSALFADPAAAVDCLYTLAMEAMRTGQLMDHKSINKSFSELSVFARPKATEAELLAAVRAASYRLRMVGKDIGGIHIQQLAVDKLLEWVNKPDFSNSHVAALLDQAGSGKTVAMSMLLERLEETGFVVLGIKVDGLAFSSQAELASVIGLPDSIPSVLQSLQVAGHRMVLLIDQLDALSSAMSRESSTISSVLDLVARTTGLQIPIVLACRSFDWKSDYRLRHLRDSKPAEFTLPELTDTQLMQVLSICALKLSDFHPLTIKILRCLLRLRVFFEIVQTKRYAEPSWMPGNTIYSLQTLYLEFWTQKMSKADSERIGAGNCEIVATILAKHMYEAQYLSAPEALVAGYRTVRDWLISEGILSLNGKILSFFHQTFFDFVFARNFVGNSQSLVEHLLNSDQGLFYRPMVRQILEYMKDVNPKQYILELKELIENPKIRKHLRWLVIAWLGQSRDLRPGELSLLEPMLANDAMRRRVLKHFSGNSAWFDMLSAERFSRWLQTLPDAEVWPITGYLETIISERQCELIRLLSPYVGKSGSWNDKISFCLAHISSDWEECSRDLLFNVLRSLFTNLETPTGWWAVALMSLAKSKPIEACKAIGIILNRFTTSWTSKSTEEDNKVEIKAQNRNARLPIAYDFLEALALLGNSTPQEFLEHTLSWTLDAMQKSCLSYRARGFNTNWRDWSYTDSQTYAPSEKLLFAISTALKNLAKSNPKVFRTLIPKLLDNQCLPAQLIIAEAYEENPLEFASDAAMFLITDSRRLRLSGRDSVSENTAKLIRACCPYWKEGDFLRVESSVLTMKNDPVKSVNELRWRGRTHLELLYAFDRKRLSAQGQDLLGQLERKFPLFRFSASRQKEVGFVGAPISQDSMRKMDDSSWLKAMRKYVNDKIRDNKPLGLSGGRIEFASALQAAAKAQPERFHAIAMDKMDVTFHIDYVTSIINGISEAGLPVELVGRLIEKFLPQLEQDNIRTVAWAIEKYAGQDIPQSLVNVFRYWVEQAGLPTNKGDLAEAGEIDQDNADNLLIDGVNSDRGAALRTLAVILLKSNPPRRGEYLDIAETITADPSAAVRAVGIEFLLYAIPADPNRSCDLFRLLIGENWLLLREQEAYNFIYSSLYKHANKVMWAIEKMLADERSPKTREAGAKLACLAAFRWPEAAPLRDACIKGDVPSRKGAAAVYSANIRETQVGMECQERLRTFLNDDDVEVRKEATTFLRDLDATCIRELADFLRVWTQTKALSEGAEDAAYMLEQNPVVDKELTLEISDCLITALGQGKSDMQGRQGIVTYRLTPAILNVYHLSVDAEARRKAIDLFEKLDELGETGVYLVMESVDRL